MLIAFLVVPLSNVASRNDAILLPVYSLDRYAYHPQRFWTPPAYGGAGLPTMYVEGETVCRPISAHVFADTTRNPSSFHRPSESPLRWTRYPLPRSTTARTSVSWRLMARGNRRGTRHLGNGRMDLALSSRPRTLMVRIATPCCTKVLIASWLRQTCPRKSSCHIRVLRFGDANKLHHPGVIRASSTL